MFSKNVQYLAMSINDSFDPGNEATVLGSGSLRVSEDGSDVGYELRELLLRLGAGQHTVYVGDQAHQLRLDTRASNERLFHLI